MPKFTQLPDTFRIDWWSSPEFLDIEAIPAVEPMGESPGSVPNQVLEPDLVSECRNPPVAGHLPHHLVELAGIHLDIEAILAVEPTW